MQHIKNKRKYFPGDEWLYYKFYIGRHYSNIFLLDCVYEAGESLKRDNIIDKWFFIRYHDPDDHIRFRVHLVDKLNLNNAISRIHELSESFTQENKLVWKIQIDTYNQEIERYGLNEINVSEELFYLSSLLSCNIIKIAKTETELIIWAIYFLKILISKIDMSEKHLIAFLSQMDKAYKDEFSINKASKNKLKLKYVDLKESINTFDKIEIPDLIKLIIERYCKLFVSSLRYDSDTKPTNHMTAFMSGHIHMFINRLFLERQREYEMMIYDALLRFYSLIIETNK